MFERRRLPYLPELLLPFLPEDLITENILIRLPVKPWRSLLSTPKFARAHFKVHSDHEPEGSILVSFSPNFAFCTLNLGNENRMVSRTTRSLALPRYEGCMNELQGSCHGLVLVKQKGSLDLFNPITRETLKIPEFCEWSYDLGLGYDSNQDDYKIVCIRADETHTLGIFSLKLKTWRNVGNMPYLHVEDGGLFVNDFLHWPAWAQDGFVLAAFSLATEEFRELPPPKGIEQVNLCCFRLTILGGRLALIYKEDGVMDIWVMKEYGVQDSWTKYTLDMSILKIHSCFILVFLVSSLTVSKRFLDVHLCSVGEQHCILTIVELHAFR